MTQIEIEIETNPSRHPIPVSHSPSRRRQSPSAAPSSLNVSLAGRRRGRSRPVSLGVSRSSAYLAGRMCGAIGLLLLPAVSGKVRLDLAVPAPPWRRRRRGRGCLANACARGCGSSHDGAVTWTGSSSPISSSHKGGRELKVIMLHPLPWNEFRILLFYMYLYGVPFGFGILVGRPWELSARGRSLFLCHNSVRCFLQIVIMYHLFAKSFSKNTRRTWSTYLSNV
jgi:hypothetical protein